VVSDLDTAKARLTTNVHLARGCVLEPYRPDLVDIQVALRSYPEIQLSAIERPIRRSATTEILDYRDKYVGGEGMVSAPREIPAILPGTQAEEIRSYAHRIGDLASVRGVARIDFLVNDHEIYINEINTIPGSLSKHLFVEPPLAFAQLLGDLIREARERPAHRFGTSGADGLVLRSAGAIASKLA
jgi:D-alanine-D-alanine ligase